MKRNQFLIAILAVISLVFVALLGLLINRQPKTLLNQNATTQVEPSIKAVGASLANLRLEPSQKSTTVGETVRVALRLEGLSSGVEAADLIFNYDPNLLEFVSIEKLHPDFTNPRSLVENGRLILSFVNKGTSESEEKVTELNIGELVLQAKKAGRSELVLDLSDPVSGSLVLNNTSSDNQLTSANKTEIIIR